jgi:hypothetical protein
MRLLLAHAHEQTGKQPFQLDFDELDAPPIGAFPPTSKPIATTAPARATTAWP